jgi:outer membrane biosynthesis protein TonB
LQCSEGVACRGRTVLKVNCIAQALRYAICSGTRRLATALMRLKLIGGTIIAVLFAVACVFSLPTIHGATENSADDTVLSDAVCPIVYPVDQSPSDRGYHYLFYGNGFFINEQGYLITAAHVLSQLRGGQAYVLLHDPSGRSRFVRAELVIVDRSHDVAILRATPNPFEGPHTVRFLPLTSDWVVESESIVVPSTRPPKPLDAYTLDGSVDDHSAGEVFDFKFSQLEKGRSDTELFLFNHHVRLGQSGAPVVSAGSREVVGLIEGQWLRPTSASILAAADQAAPGVGAAVPMHYAIALLKQKEISWHTIAGDSNSSSDSAQPAEGFSPPTPLSLVACSFPSQAIFGGEVVLDSLIDSHGRLMQIRVVRGTSPYLEKALDAVQTWSFYPARIGDHPAAARVGITFQFLQLHERGRTPAVHKFAEPSAVWPERAALPVVTADPLFPATMDRDGGVILSDIVAADGQLSSVKVLSQSESLAPEALAALRQWRFVPGKRAGIDADSAGIVVMAFRHGGKKNDADQAK